MSRKILGIQPVREAIRARAGDISRVFIQREAGPTLEALGRHAVGQSIEVREVDRGELDRMAAGGRHQGVIAEAAELSLTKLAALEVTENTLVAALDGVMDPQNFGAVVRSSVALGATAVMWPEHSSAPLSPSAFRASAGAIEHAILCRVRGLPEAIEELTGRGVTAVALDAQGPTELSELDLVGPVAIVIGAEDKGVRKPVRRACQHTARLPMTGPIGSLNASVAGALALYEVQRQRAARRRAAES